MGKPTGFLEHDRVNESSVPVDARTKNYKEFVITHSDDEASRQGARCMDCGIPFCQSGCPVNNIIPDWNDLVYRHDWQSALQTLHSTNNFPEFTGRICPAPCEASCTLNINDSAVAIKSIEHAIVDKGWSNDWIVPQAPKVKTGKRVAVVGSGPAGLACAQQLARVGHDVVVFEKNDRIGGLLRYGIPDFKMEKTHIDRRVSQMEQEGVEFRTSVFVGSGGEPITGVSNLSQSSVNHEKLLKDFDAIALTGGSEIP
ncbi:MAG: glutamate synthase subunit beta, partial [Betaproteobacteria bacterium]|nr:glutamate synthase subunit beta [Betaproteobacteria bacterium]